MYSHIYTSTYISELNIYISFTSIGIFELKKKFVLIKVLIYVN